MNYYFCKCIEKKVSIRLPGQFLQRQKKMGKQSRKVKSHSFRQFREMVCQENLERTGCTEAIFKFISDKMKISASIKRTGRTVGTAKERHRCSLEGISSSLA